MADTVTSQVIMDGRRNALIKLTNKSDGTGESAVLKVDISTLSGAPDAVSIDRIDYDVAGMAVQLLWDADTDVEFATLGDHGTIDFKAKGGLTNNAGTGKTGDINLTTIGASSGDTYTIWLHLHKKYAAGR